MKKILIAVLASAVLASTAAVSLTACGGEGTVEPTPEVTPSSQQEQQIDTSTPDAEEPADEPVTSTADPLPAGVEIPLDQYPWLEGLVLPDNAVVSSIDDEWYADSGVVTLYVKPITTADQVAAYEQKLADAGYTPAEVSGLVSPDGKFEIAVGDTWIEIDGYIDLTIYDVNWNK